MVTPEFLQLALQVAEQAARAAAEPIKRYYQTPIAAMSKGDASPVTVADIEAEAAIKAILGQVFPDHLLWGEESGKTGVEDSDFIWLIDPLDGTKSFVRGYPHFATLLALRHQGEFVLGLSYAPMRDELCTAARGLGSFRNGKPIATSDCIAFGSAHVSTGNLKTLAVDAAWQRFGRMIPRFERIRGYGDFLHYHLLAAGEIDAVLDSDVHILDVAGFSVLVHEAGGVMTDMYGEELNLASRSVLAAATPELHRQLLDELWPR
jgi:histidinol-phosphatase